MGIFMVSRDECYDKYRELESAGLPDDVSLPFLAYGFFKPHQLAYSQIKRNVCEYEKADIHYQLMNLNGMPVLHNKAINGSVDAYVIRFEEGKETYPYRAIGYSRNMHIYSWEVVSIEDADGNCQDVNVLMYAGDKSPKNFHGFENNNYDWRNDPVFDNTLKYLDMNIKGLKGMNFQYKWDDLKPLIGVQSLYMSLWSALDRFLSFRYGKSQTRNVKLLSDEKSFRKSLKKNYNAIKDKGFYGGDSQWKDEIFSAEDLTNYNLDRDKPACSALYYYALRNNVVHSSKVSPQEMDTVWNALVGLTEIFRDVLNAVKRE